jgi:hypothetical protein
LGKGPFGWYGYNQEFHVLAILGKHPEAEWTLAVTLRIGVAHRIVGQGITFKVELGEL